MMLKEVNICSYHYCNFSTSAATAGCPPPVSSPPGCHSTLDPLAGSKNILNTHPSVPITVNCLVGEASSHLIPCSSGISSSAFLTDLRSGFSLPPQLHTHQKATLAVKASSPHQIFLHHDGFQPPNTIILFVHMVIKPRVQKLRVS